MEEVIMRVKELSMPEEEKEEVLKEITLYQNYHFRPESTGLLGVYFWTIEGARIRKKIKFWGDDYQVSLYEEGGEVHIVIINRKIVSKWFNLFWR